MDHSISGKKAFSIREMVYGGVAAAVIFVCAMFIHIPYGAGGVVHFGDSILFATAVLLGRKQGAAAGAIGLALFDMASGYMAYAPYTFVIKLLMGLVVGTIAFSGGARGGSFVRNFIGMVLGGVVMVAGYFGAEYIMTGSAAAPTAMILGNVIQGGASVIIGMVLVAALKKTRIFSNI